MLLHVVLGVFVFVASWRIVVCCVSNCVSNCCLFVFRRLVPDSTVEFLLRKPISTASKFNLFAFFLFFFIFCFFFFLSSLPRPGVYLFRLLFLFYTSCLSSSSLYYYSLFFYSPLYILFHFYSSIKKKSRLTVHQPCVSKVKDCQIRYRSTVKSQMFELSYF